MGKYIVAVFVLILLLLPEIIWRVYKAHRYSEYVKEFVSKPFVCPNCGHRFYVTKRVFYPLDENKAILKCPKCGKRDICTRPYDLDLNE